MCARNCVCVCCVQMPAMQKVLYLPLCVSDPRVSPPGWVLVHTDLFAFEQPLIFFSGFRSEQLLNGHCSSETGHCEVQRGLAMVSALQNLNTHRDSHMHLPGKAQSSHGFESEMWTFSRCFPPQKWLWGLFTLLNLTTVESKGIHGWIIMKMMWLYSVNI